MAQTKRRYTPSRSPSPINNKKLAAAINKDINSDSDINTNTHYLDTIDRIRLDFDFEKQCSVTLKDFNVYACLVCGKYYQGRGETTQAYLHSIEHDHHVFIRIDGLEVYILPEDYKVVDSSLDDIKYVIQPYYTASQLQQLIYSSTPKYAYDLSNKKYLPGYIGLNNIRENDYINVILQVLIHVPPIAHFFLLDKAKDNKSKLVQKFGLLTRKVFNPRAFKGQVSPHELLQEISLQSNKQFQIEKRGEPVTFLSWFLNRLHRDLGGSSKKKTIITQTFQGSIEVSSLALEDIGDVKQGDRSYLKSNFLYLTLDLPPQPLFQDTEEVNIIPQVPLTTLVTKFDGKTEQETTSSVKLYKITQLPPYLIMYYKRFAKNAFNHEKNPTIVTFPLENLSLGTIFSKDPMGADELLRMSYDLISTTTHSGGDEPHLGSYHAYIKRPGNMQWFKITDLNVEPEVPELIQLSEAYLQVWRRKDLKDHLIGIEK